MRHNSELSCSLSSRQSTPSEHGGLNHTLVVDQYLHFVPPHNTNTRVCCPKVDANNGLARFDDRVRGGGTGGSGDWDRGQGAQEDEEEDKDADP